MCRHKLFEIVAFGDKASSIPMKYARIYDCCSHLEEAVRDAVALVLIGLSRAALEAAGEPR